ncbi:MAG: DNA recombination protein RmuC [Clostridia bacterium]
MEYIIIVLLVLSIALNIYIITKSKNSDKTNDLKNEILQLSEKTQKDTNEIKKDILLSVEKNQKDTIDFIQRQLETQNNSQVNLQKQIGNMENERFKDFSTNTQNTINTLRVTINEMIRINENQLVQMRETLEKKVSSMQESNEKKLDEMRLTVDEKLQKTLEDRISQSFKLVSERLEQVYQSLGEMQKVSAGVDDLKKVLSNVKTRGILGEVQLGAILEQILNNEQYDTNVITKKGSNDRVEFAVKLPGDNGEHVYLPIDSKFPMDAYQNLLDAYETGVQTNVDESVKVLKNRIKAFAKDIKNKYIDVPNTTEFGIMFLPFEGLYAEVVRCGMIEELQKEKINIAGPTTMAALLNSLQMGFKTLAIQKRSSEVWQVLEGVKQEFSNFGNALEKTQQRMRQASDELDKLVVTRTNAINRKLKNVSSLSDKVEQ